MAAKSLYGHLSLRVEDTDGNVLIEDAFINDSDLTHDPNPEFTVIVSTDVGGD